MSRRFKNGFQISGGFCLLAAWFGVINGWRLLAVVLGAAAAHELGHFAALKCVGACITGMRLNMFGAAMETDRSALSYGKELAAVLAGPAANLLCAILLSLMESGNSALIGANLILCVFNLLPVRPLDGGHALYLTVSCAAGPEAGERAARWTGLTAAVFLAAVLGILMWRSGGSLWLLPAMAGLLTAAVRECHGKSMNL